MPPEDRAQARRLRAAEMLRTPEVPAEVSAQEIVDAIGEDVLDRVLARFDEEDRQVVETAKRLAAAGRSNEAPPPSPFADPQIVLDWGQATGRIAASARPQWERSFAASQEHTDALVRVLAPTPPVQASPPVVRAGYTSTPQTASGLDVSTLPRGLRAAAARCGDRATVYRLVERYGGDLEADPMLLRLEGFDSIAADVERDANEARAEATRALNESIAANGAAHQAQLAAEHQRRRMGEE